MKGRLWPGDRGVLEARLRAATTEQRQLLRLKPLDLGAAPITVHRDRILFQISVIVTR